MLKKCSLFYFAFPIAFAVILFHTGTGAPVPYFFRWNKRFACAFSPNKKPIPPKAKSVSQDF